MGNKNVEIVDLGLGEGVGKGATIDTYALNNMSQDTLSTKTFKNKGAGVGDGLGSAMFGAGSLINAGTSLYGTINSVIQNRKALDLQKRQVELAETQYADEKARYDKRQTEIDATNAAVGEAVQGWGESAKKETQNLPMNRI